MPPASRVVTESITPVLATSRAVTGLLASSGRRFDFTPKQSRWVVGSQPSCDLVLTDPCVSSLHCVIDRLPLGGVIVRDRGSRNGTFVNGNAVEGAVLSVGDRVLVGRTTLIVQGDPHAGARSSAWGLLRGESPSFAAVRAAAAKAARSDCSVLVIGETGTGKDVVARAIFERSRRFDGPFVAVNCGAIPRELIASELFGHVKGAFTGASEDREGYFLQADGGTLFLDELGELPLELQPHLLRVLEDRRVRPLGGAAERPFDVRVIAATNRVEGLGTAASRLRLDLFHRVATIVINMPPLRERKDDLPGLVASFLAEHGGGQAKRLSDEAWGALLAYEWPGNVRELRAAVARAVTMGNDVLEPDDFFPNLAWPRLEVGKRARNGTALAPYEVPIYEEMARTLRVHGSVRGAAAAMGMAKSTFSDRAVRWGLMKAPPRPA